MSAKNHRSAFAADPRFQARIASALGDSKPLSAAAGSVSAVTEPHKPSRAMNRAQKVKEANKDGLRDTIHLDVDGGSLTFVFPGAKLLGLNAMLRMHNAKASSLKETWNQRIRAAALENRGVLQQWQQIVRFPLIVEEIYITGESALLDRESVVGSCKPIIDALVNNAVVPDDNCNFLCQPLGFTERGPSPCILIRLKPSPRPWGYIDDSTVEIARGVARDAS